MWNRHSREPNRVKPGDVLLDVNDVPACEAPGIRAQEFVGDRPQVRFTVANRASPLTMQVQAQGGLGHQGGLESLAPLPVGLGAPVARDVGVDASMSLSMNLQAAGLPVQPGAQANMVSPPMTGLSGMMPSYWAQGAEVETFDDVDDNIDEAPSAAAVPPAPAGLRGGFSGGLGSERSAETGPLGLGGGRPPPDAPPPPPPLAHGFVKQEAAAKAAAAKATAPKEAAASPKDSSVAKVAPKAAIPGPVPAAPTGFGSFDMQAGDSADEARAKPAPKAPPIVSAKVNPAPATAPVGKANGAPAAAPSKVPPSPNHFAAPPPKPPPGAGLEGFQKQAAKQLGPPTEALPSEPPSGPPGDPPPPRPKQGLFGGPPADTPPPPRTGFGGETDEHSQHMPPPGPPPSPPRSDVEAGMSGTDSGDAPAVPKNPEWRPAPKKASPPSAPSATGLGAVLPGEA